MARRGGVLTISFIDVIKTLLTYAIGRTLCAVIVFTALNGIVAPSVSDAQIPDTSGPRPRYGVFGDFVQSMHTADFERLAGRTDIPYVSRFESGNGVGIALGALFDMPLSESIWLLLRGSYQSDAADLTASER